MLVRPSEVATNSRFASKAGNKLSRRARGHPSQRDHGDLAAQTRFEAAHRDLLTDGRAARPGDDIRAFGVGVGGQRVDIARPQRGGNAPTNDADSPRSLPTPISQRNGARHLNLALTARPALVSGVMATVSAAATASAARGR